MMSRWQLKVMVCVGLGLSLHACSGDSPMDPGPNEPDGPMLVPLRDLLDGSVSVVANPSEISPLAAQAIFRSRVPVTVMVTVLGREPVAQEFPGATREHTIAMLGLYPGTVNEVELRVSDGDVAFAVDTIEVVTDPLPEFFPTVEIRTADRSSMEPGWTLSSLSIGNQGVFPGYPIMFDHNGDIRWYLDLSFLGDMVFAVERFANGNLLVGRAGTIYEFDMLGAEVNRWPIPGYTHHHDVIEKPDGNLLVAVDKEGLETLEDHVIEVDRGSGAIVAEWDLRQVLDMNRTIYSGVTDDWFHMNSVWYDEGDDALIVSGRNQTAVVKVSRSNELVWILSPHEEWGLAGPNGDGHDTADFLLTAVNAQLVPYEEAVQLGDEDIGAEFRWPWGQHAAMLLPNGNLFVFDNGLARNWSRDTPLFSRGVEYEIDPTEMTVRQVWEYGESRGEEYYSANISDVDYLPLTGNRVIMPGNVSGDGRRGFVTEVTYPDGVVVFEAVIHYTDLLGTGSGWGQIDLVYRSERASLYP